MSEGMETSTQRILNLNGRTITLIGTAHVSAESMKEVEAVIRETKPDCVAVELDEKRADSIKNPEKYSQLDIVKVLKNNQGFLLMANLVLSSFQRRMGQNTGVKPGAEMLKGMEVAEELGIPVVLADRPIQTTFKRAWGKNTLWGKCKLLAALISSAFSKEEMSEEDIEGIKEKSEMDSMMNELADYMPVVKQVLIDERNLYLANKIWAAPGNSVIAVLGAGHLDGVVENLEKLAANQPTDDMEEISATPKKSFGSKLIGWLIPAAIVGLIVAGFIYGGTQLGKDMVLSWVLWNGCCAALLTALAAGHPVTVIVAFVSAPITSLCPFIGCGFVTAIVQAVICKPKVADMETLQDDISFKGIYKNRILRILLIFILSSLGSSLATFISGADIIGKFVGAEKQPLFDNSLEAAAGMLE
ncbi:MAG: TraB/GumN family protein [Treponema sp.]|nr:TraB/GumN family protein [Treponema sp.]